MRFWTFDLQRFADGDPDPTGTQTIPADPTDPSGDPSPPSASGSDPGQGGPSSAQGKTFTQEELDRHITRRLAEDRQRRGGKGGSAQGDSPWLQFGQQIESHPEAERLRAELQEVINRNSQIDPATAAMRTVQSFEQRMTLQVAEVELRASDPVFRQNEAVIKDWAEENGIVVTSPAELRMATLAWKDANATQIAANAQVDAQRAAQAAAAAKQNGALVSGGGTRQPAADPRKMSDAEWLRSQGLSYLKDS